MATLSRCAFAALAAASLYGPAPVLAQQAKTPESELLSSDDLAPRRKLQPLVRCLNEMGTAVPTLVDTYHRACAVLNKNPKVDFPKMDYWFMQQYTGQVFSVSGSRTALKCADGLADVPQLPPADADIEALAARYADNLHKLDEVAPKVEKYYNQQNYKDDAMAAGRTLNTEYEPVLNALAADTRTMFGEVQKRSDGIDERRVDAIAQHDGKRLRWEANAFMLQARTTIHALDRLQSGKAPKEQVVAAVTPLEARFEEADAYAKAHPEENTDDMNLWKCAYSGAESLVTDAKKVRRAAAEGKPYDTEYVRRQYNSLVDNANVCKR